MRKEYQAYFAGRANNFASRCSFCFGGERDCYCCCSRIFAFLFCLAHLAAPTPPLSLRESAKRARERVELAISQSHGWNTLRLQCRYSHYFWPTFKATLLLPPTHTDAKRAPAIRSSLFMFSLHEHQYKPEVLSALRLARVCLCVYVCVCNWFY